MASRFDISYLRSLLETLDSLVYEYKTGIDEQEDYDYDDLKKRIYNIQLKIKSIVEKWEELEG